MEGDVAAAVVPQAAVVRNDATGKKYKVAVRHAIAVDGAEGQGVHNVAQDITVLTLKKNFTGVIGAPSYQHVVVKWERSGCPHGRGETLSDTELIPLEGTLVLEVSAAIDAAAPPPPPNISSSTRPPPAPRDIAGNSASKVHATKSSNTPQQQLATPQRRELLDLANQMFRGESPPLRDSTNTPRGRDDATLDSAHLQEDDGYRSVADSVRPERRGLSARRSVSAIRHEDPNLSRSPPDSRHTSDSSMWMERCLLLERQKDSLEKKLQDMEREVSVGRIHVHGEHPPPVPRVVAASSSEISTQQSGANLLPAPPVMQPSKALQEELSTLQRRRKMLRDVRTARVDEWEQQKQHLQSSIHGKKNALIQTLRQRLRDSQGRLSRVLVETSDHTVAVHALQKELSATDAQADMEKVRVDEATRRLDRCKERMIALLTQMQPGPLSDEGVRKKDMELAQFIASTAAQKHKHLVALDLRSSRTKHLRGTYEETLQQRVRLHHSVEDAKGNIRVIVRMRPVVPNDASQPQHIKHLEDGALEVDEARNAVFLSTPTTGMKRFEFYSVYGPAQDSVAQQGVLFEEQVRPLLKSVLDGTNVAVMAYGPTGSGKTFTILGKTESGQLSGLLPQSVEFLLDTLMAPSTPQTPLSSNSETRLQVVESCTMTMVEVYMDQVYDILGQLHGALESAAKVDVRQGSDTVSLNGVTEVPVSRWDDAVRYLQEGLRLRKTHRTLKNLESSRSHLIVSLHLVVQATGGATYRSKLVFVDLAGSERVSKSLSQGERLKEAQHINKSLSALGDVVHALSTTPRPAYIPYRNSRLTQLLFDAIGGNAKTLLITCICPHLPQQHNMSETQSTLQFASRAKNVRNALVQRAHSTPNTSIDSSHVEGDQQPL